MSVPELIRTATMTAQLGESFTIPGGPLGTRVIAEVDSVDVAGERFNATMVGKSAADWLTVAGDGTWGVLDVRFTLRTNDDAIVYCEYGGRIDLAAGKVVSAPTFQTGAEQYQWLNRTQYIADGTLTAETGTLVYELYEVRVS